MPFPSVAHLLHIHLPNQMISGILSVNFFFPIPVVSKNQSPLSSHRFLSVGHLKLSSYADMYLITFPSSYEK